MKLEQNKMSELERIRCRFEDRNPEVIRIKEPESLIEETPKAAAKEAREKMIERHYQKGLEND